MSKRTVADRGGLSRRAAARLDQAPAIRSRADDLSLLLLGGRAPIDMRSAAVVAQPAPPTVADRAAPPTVTAASNMADRAAWFKDTGSLAEMSAKFEPKAERKPAKRQLSLAEATRQVVDSMALSPPGRAAGGGGFDAGVGSDLFAGGLADADDFYV